MRETVYVEFCSASVLLFGTLCYRRREMNSRYENKVVDSYYTF